MDIDKGLSGFAGVRRPLPMVAGPQTTMRRNAPAGLLKGSSPWLSRDDFAHSARSESAAGIRASTTVWLLQVFEMRPNGFRPPAINAADPDRSGEVAGFDVPVDAPLAHAKQPFQIAD